MDQPACPSSAQRVPQTTTTTASPPIPAPWLHFLDSMQPLPDPHPQASRVPETHAPPAHPSLEAHHVPQNTDFINDTPFTYTSPTSTASEPSALHLSHDTEARPPRKRENRYRNAPPSVLSRRRAQNRASQRAYRERKEQRIRDLEHLLQEAHQREETLAQAYLSLHAEYERLGGEHQENSGLETARPVGVSGETMLAHLDPASMLPSSDIVGDFDFSAIVYEHPDNTQH